ncbi:MAG: hypothetical protein ABTS22_18000 [Accumulibacter sp.]|uniref:hypothetical protein n=1 Tax=Accumulibacter sp. TaxID=2053492 RepID=UPI00331545DA
MTEPLQDFPSDPPLSRLYRQFATDEPSQAIDERILAAAKAALGAGERSPGADRGRWWRRWRTPLALATTLVLTLTLSLLQQPPPGDGFVPAVPGPQVAPAPAAAPPAKFADPEARPAAAVVPPSPARTAGAMSDRQAETRQQSRPALTGVGERDREVKSESVAERVSSAAAKPAPPATEPAATRSERTDVAPAVAGTVTGNRSEAPLAAAPGRVPAAALAKSRAQAVRTASVWLDEIRALRREGNLQEAERQLREFRREYPDYPLPEDLRP